MNFCPRCGTPLVPRLDGGRDRPTCPAEGCGYTYYGDASIGTGAVVLREDRVLLIQRKTAERIWWQIPGGFVEIDESITEAIEREILEETGVTARVRDVIAIRHAAGVQPQWPIANMYTIMRLDHVAGEPRPDLEESFEAGFYSIDEARGLQGLSGISLWAIERALGLPNHGMRVEPIREGLQRPGHTLLGLPLE